MSAHARQTYIYMSVPVLAIQICAACTAGSALRQAVKRMQLQNTGDLAARFAWDAASLGPYFSVTPASGQVEAGQELALEVAFRPTCALADMHAQEVPHTGSMTGTTVEHSQTHMTSCCPTSSPQCCVSKTIYANAVSFNVFSSSAVRMMH